MIDDLTPLHQLSETVAGSDFHLYQPMPSYRMSGGSGRPSKTEGQNHPGGVMVHYYLKEKPADTVAVKIAFYEMDGDLIKEFATDAKERGNKIDEIKAGGNRFVWNMRYPDAKDFKGMILWGGNMAGPQAVPGKYKVKLTLGEETVEQEFEILIDPRSESTIADLQEQFDFVQGINNKVSESHQAIIDIRDAREQMKSLSERMKTQEDSEDILEKIKAIQKSLTKVEEELYQTKNRSRQDPLNYPIKLTNKLAAVKSISDRGDFAPTEQSKQVRKELTEKIDEQLQIYREVINSDLPELNRMVQEKAIDAIMIKQPKVVN